MTEYKIQEVRVVNGPVALLLITLMFMGMEDLYLEDLRLLVVVGPTAVYVKSSKFGFRDNNPRGDHVTLSNGVSVHIVRTIKSY